MKFLLFKRWPEGLRVKTRENKSSVLMEEEWSYVHPDKHLVLDCKKTNPAHHETISTGLLAYPLVLIYPAYKEIVELGGKNMPTPTSTPPAQQ